MGSRVVKATAEKSQRPDIFRRGCLIKHARTRKYAPFFFLMLASVVVCGEPPPAPRPRLMPDIPEVLWYCNFEDGVSPFNGGAIHQDTPCQPGTRAYKSQRNDNNKDKGERWAGTGADLKDPNIAFPAGVDPNTIFIHVQVWSDIPGDVIIKCRYAAGDYQTVEHLKDVKSWVPIVVPMMELRNKNVKPEAAHVCNGFEIYLKTRGKEWPNFYFDNILVTQGANPLTILPKLLVREKKAASLKRTPDKDGFKYSLEGQDALLAALKGAPRRKDKTVLIAAPRAEDAAALVTQLAGADKKGRPLEFKLLPVSNPGGDAVGGWEDTRAFLSHNLSKTDAQIALIVLSPADLLTQPRPLDGIQAILERTLNSGSIPVICTPPVPALIPNREKYVAVINTITGMCDRAGVPWIDGSLAVKNATMALNGNDLTVSGLEGIAAAVLPALKHTYESMSRK